MYIKSFILLLLTLLLVLDNSANEREKHPNIIFILTDDQGWGDVGYNNHPHIKTPALDEMVAHGIRFDRFYSGASTCSPSRAAFITGRHNLRLGVLGPCGVPKQGGDWHLDRNELTLAEGLKTKGYATAHFGKWHLGHFHPEQGTEHILLPSEAGFDEYFTSHNILYTYDPYQAIPTNKDEGHLYLDNGRLIGLEEGQSRPELRRDDATILMDKTLDFIGRQDEAGKPFFIALWLHHVHAPLGKNPELMKRFSHLPEAEAIYYSNIASVDQEVGRLRNELRRMGIADNTLLIFTSDNGPVGGMRGESLVSIDKETGKPFRYNGRGSAGPFRGGKWQEWEGGIRVPAVMEWPNRIKKPIRTKMACSAMDIVPTIFELIDIELPKDRVYDGISLVPLMEGRQTVRDKPIASVGMKQRVWMSGHYKIITPYENGLHPFDQLYDMENDPYEQHNLAKEKPEILEAMSKDYHAWEKEALNDAEDATRQWKKWDGTKN